jgi:hypothetical protein
LQENQDGTQLLKEEVTHDDNIPVSKMLEFYKDASKRTH